MSDYKIVNFLICPQIMKNKNKTQISSEVITFLQILSAAHDLCQLPPQQVSVSTM